MGKTKDRYSVYMNRDGVSRVAGLDGKGYSDYSPVPAGADGVSIDRFARLLDSSVAHLLNNPSTREETEFILATQVNRKTRGYFDHRYFVKEDQEARPIKPSELRTIKDEQRRMNPTYLLRLARDKRFANLYNKTFNEE